MKEPLQHLTIVNNSAKTLCGLWTKTAWSGRKKGRRSVDYYNHWPMETSPAACCVEWDEEPYCKTCYKIAMSYHWAIGALEGDAE